MGALLRPGSSPENRLGEEADLNLIGTSTAGLQIGGSNLPLVARVLELLPAWKLTSKADFAGWHLGTPVA